MKTQCKLCFEEFEPKGLFSIFERPYLCSECSKKFEPRFIDFSLNGIDGFAIYAYDETIKSTLYQFKGACDYELKDVFFNKLKIYLHLKYSKYTLVPIPSLEKDNQERGFNHVEEIFKTLNLKIINILQKKGDYKQSEKNKEERKNIEKYLSVKKYENLTNLDILIVDDVLTTGNTIASALKLIQKMNPKTLKILVLSLNCRFLENFGDRKKLFIKTN